MKLGLLTAIWGRPRLTGLFVKYYTDMCFERRLIVESAIDDIIGTGPYMNGVHWDVVHHDNDPLSDKWLAGISAFRKHYEEDVDGLMIVGSDDLVTPKYVEACKYLLAKGVDYIYLPGFYFYDTATSGMIWAYAKRLGAGRVVSRRLLDMLDWKPWDEGLAYGLDGNMWDKVKALKEVKVYRFPSKLCRDKGIVGIDIKTGDNLWDYDHIKNNLLHDNVYAHKVLNRYFPTVSKELLNWSKTSRTEDPQISN